MENKIIICSAAILSPEEHLLMVRKRGSVFYQLPGGKVEDGESHIETVVRELAEELSLITRERELHYLGTHRTAAVNEPDTVVEGFIFLLKLPIQTDFRPQAELEEIRWISKEEYPNFKFAHLADEFVVPRWLRGGF